MGDVMGKGQYSKALPLKGKKGDPLKVRERERESMETFHSSMFTLCLHIKL